jgi:hypothetical protein
MPGEPVTLGARAGDEHRGVRRADTLEREARVIAPCGEHRVQWRVDEPGHHAGGVRGLLFSFRFLRLDVEPFGRDRRAPLRARATTCLIASPRSA